VADARNPPVLKAPCDVLAGGGRLTQLNDRAALCWTDAQAVTFAQSAKVEAADGEILANGAWVEVMPICIHARNLFNPKEADRLLRAAVHWLFGALSVTNQPARCNDGAINRSLRDATRVRDIDAADQSTAPRERPWDLPPRRG
jgi:hypothetical protein